ncbi:endo-1,4-beta-xylanase [Sphingobacterium litopenaei]|uniref:endo-1,4-beta-xylanase n=1 Tax=Sphingobacterium litopenaei TaxID=2763500 RepID=A0ABR7Y9U3_9SPHI|nr:endo-1,4-beta-xylanase [Sphingobacterium litopenaei]MBD1428075.1 endo-1,4-beta-xylanase [Sphingobacterium litopenaei]
MKRLHTKLGYGLMVSLLLSSCAKPEFLDYFAEKPESVIAQEDINSYDPLISYIDQNANPNFKLGVALNIDDYINKGVMYRLVNRNFNEMVMGYEMKHSSIVKADGTMDFSRVEKLIETAKENNVAIFGHTLTWHSGQNAAYLNKLIAPIKLPGSGSPTWDVITSNNFESADNSNYEFNTNAVVSFTAAGQGEGGEGRALKLVNAEVRANDWDTQLFIKFPAATKLGEKYRFTMYAKSDAPAEFGSQAHTVPYSYKHWDFFGSFKTTSEWVKFEREINIGSDTENCTTIAFNLGKTATTYYFDNFTVEKYNEEGSGGSAPIEKGFALKMINPSVVNTWEAQAAFDISGIENNTEYVLTLAAKGSKAGTLGADLQSTSDYQGNSFGSVALTTDYQEFELKLTTTAVRNRFIFNFGHYDGTIYVDNVKLVKAGSNTNIIGNGDFENGIDGWIGWGNNSSRVLSADGEGFGGMGGNVIEKTPEEKKDIITNALEDFIKGMMTTTKEYVKAWDVVNEPMSDWPDQYALKTGIGKAEMADDEFYWQDYMGKDYAVKAIEFARKYGNTNDLLFINDYGLEGGGNKCKGLIAYVEYVESKGAKVDGIGTQMHIDINTNKDNIVSMFQLLAATGKLIKISELDIGVGVKTPQATAEMYARQADMYKFVIEKYFEIIPKAQQYGITIWSPLDSPDNEYSFWRRGEPIGIWTEGFVRKPAYKAVTEALGKMK